MCNTGRPKREDLPLPPKVQRALVLRSGGATWKDCADAVGLRPENLRKYRDHPDFNGFLDSALKDHLRESHSALAAAAPRVAQRLVDIALDPATRSYAAVGACSEIFKILQNGVIETEQRQQLREIQDQLTNLERMKAINF